MEQDKKEGEAPEAPKDENKPVEEQADLDTLENPSTIDETAAATEASEDAEKKDGDITDTTHGANIKKRKLKLRGVDKIRSFNIYLLLFLLLLVVAGVIGFVSYDKNKKAEEATKALLTEPLSQETLDKLKQSDVRVGDPKQILSVESNAIFAGKVLIRDSLEVAGQLKIGGTLNLPGITVSGASTFGQINVNALDVSGNTNVGGTLAVQQGLTVGGNLSVSGTLTAGRLTLDNLEVNGDLKLNKHIDTGGGTPGKSNGGALGSGGSSSVSGTDTAGTVNINTGGGSGTGCYVSISFTQSFNATPHVVVTPVGSAAGSLNWYISRSSSGFSICTASAAGGGKSFAFDYIVID